MNQSAAEPNSRREVPQAPTRRDRTNFRCRTYQPFRLTRELLSRDPFRDARPWQTEIGTYLPAFEVKETTDRFSFSAALPGLDEHDIDVTAAGQRLTIRGKCKEDKASEYFARSPSQGTFRRVFTLPQRADVSHVKLELKDGAVTILVPKIRAGGTKAVSASATEQSEY